MTGEMKLRSYWHLLLPFKLVGRLVGEYLVGTYGIVKGFDMLEHRDLGLIEVFVVQKFGPILPHCP